jgi:hypothetical protein
MKAFFKQPRFSEALETGIPPEILRWKLSGRFPESGFLAWADETEMG